MRCPKLFHSQHFTAPQWARATAKHSYDSDKSSSGTKSYIRSTEEEKPKSARKRGTFKKSPRLLLVGVGFLPQGSGLFDFSTRRCDFFAFAEDKDRGFWKNRGMRARRCLRWPVQKR